MTPSPTYGAPMQREPKQPRQQQRSQFPKYRENAQPGNEPGGANGQYGRFGQTPDMQPSADFNSKVDAQRKGFQSPHRRSPMPGQANGMGTMQRQSQRYGQPAQQPSVEPMAQPQGMDQQEQPPVQYGQPFQRPTGRENDSRQPDIDYATPQITSAGSATEMPPPPVPETITAQPQPQQNTFASPFGNMRFGAPPTAMEDGQMVTEPTLAMLGENGPEAVVPMSGNPNAKITPGMMQPRDTFNTGESSLGKPLHSLPPTSRFPRYGA